MWKLKLKTDFSKIVCEIPFPPLRNMKKSNIYNNFKLDNRPKQIELSQRTPNKNVQA